MKKVMLLMLGLSLFAVSCKKQETQNENNSMSDSAATGTMSPDNTTTGTSPMDTTASVRDSAMNQGSGTGNQTTAPNQTTSPNQNNGTNGGTQNSPGTGTDAER